MTGSKELLSNYKESIGPTVTFGDNSHGVTMGIGNILRGNICVKDVSYVTGLKYNLLSISQFCDRGFKVKFSKDLCLIRESCSNRLMLTGTRMKDIYTVDWSSSTPNACFVAKSKDSSWLWHKRLNHLNYKTINRLARKNLVEGLP